MGKDTVWAIRVRRVKRWWPLTLIALMVIFWCVGLIWAARGPYPTQERILREAIHSSMKDPESARIGPIEWERKEQFLRAQGWVYGTNSFGGIVREDFEAWFARLAEGEPFTLVDVKWER